ncbi:hypothetical protein N2600_03965 [Rhizobium sp. WSM1274]|uniref:hypothetical protein n=1 Tax=Rhizobium sp. WSM1274 TaxID=3138254 RepID=UPI0021A6F2A1|nr:hypothetical protein [Rhizobium leguminosarum]UWU29137.1 hypothetical protein N2600_03965 [Rhizobium leguminosarum bv. viciae]
MAAKKNENKGYEMEKMFEIIANDHSYGIYPGEDKMSALEAQVSDAGYRGIADLLETTGQSLDEFLAETKAIEIEIKRIRIDFWEEEKVAVYFTLCLDEEKISTLEWVDSDGDLEVSDSHIDSAHQFSHHLKMFINDKLNDYLNRHRDEVDELFEAIAA